MIKFLQHIRKSLIEQNKMGKYFKYAIGEIILVIIGILIAIQINNWNENRLNNNKLKSYITEIVKDLKNDTENIQEQKYISNLRMETAKSFLAHKDYNELTIDSLEKSLETFYSSIAFSKSTFEKIESSGITDFGEYESLIENYKTYYNFIIPNILSFEGTHNRAVDKEDDYWRYDQKIYEFTYDDNLVLLQSEKESKAKLIQLLRSPTARNILKIDYRRHKFNIERLDQLKTIIDTLIKTTEEKLND